MRSEKSKKGSKNNKAKRNVQTVEKAPRRQSKEEIISEEELENRIAISGDIRLYLTMHLRIFIDGYFHHLLAVVIPLKGFQHQRRGQRVKVIPNSLAIALRSFSMSSSSKSSGSVSRSLIRRQANESYRYIIRITILR